MTNKTIQYYTGDATRPVGDGNKIVAHICNNMGQWGAGFVLAISNRWTAPEINYKIWAQNKLWYGPTPELDTPFRMGMTQFVCVQSEELGYPSKLWVANMVAQNNKFPNMKFDMNHRPLVRYDEVRRCLKSVREKALATNSSVHMPRIGCGIGGGRWGQMEGIITRALVDHGVETFVYDMPPKGDVNV